MVLIRSLISFFLFLPSFSSPAFSSVDPPQGIVILDEEIQDILQNWTSQLFRVAGLSRYKPKIYLIHRSELNAFATVGGQMAVYTGLIQNCQTGGELVGVLAHEVGHIAGGHLAQQRQAAQQSLIPAAVNLLVGGALATLTGNPAPLMAGMMGGSHVFQMQMLHFSRVHESSADQAALQYLHRLGWGAEGMLSFFQTLNTRYSGALAGVSPYFLTHPLTQERMDAVSSHLKHSSPVPFPDPMHIQFQWMKAKVVGFFSDSKKILANGDSSKDVYKIYERTIALYRVGRNQEALQTLDSLIHQFPQRPYLYELKGQIQFELGKRSEAILSLKKAIQLCPKAKYIPLLLAQILMEGGNEKEIQEAKAILLACQQKEGNSAVWRLLAIAYGKLKEEGECLLALAEEALSLGQRDRAQQFLSKLKKQKGLPASLTSRIHDFNEMLKASTF